MKLLSAIFANKRTEVAASKVALSEAKLEKRCAAIENPPDFAACLQRSPGDPMRIIAEIKWRSPSKGELTADFRPAELAHSYAKNGAAAISVLTDEKYFGGSLELLAEVASLGIGLPILRKDFIFDRYQLLEARVAGASAVLLIAAMLQPTELKVLLDETESLGLEALVEVRNRRELDVALGLGAQTVGVNNRNLQDFTVNIRTSLELASAIPGHVTSVSESGIRTPAEMARIADAGFDAALIGEALMQADDAGLLLQTMQGRGRR